MNTTERNWSFVLIAVFAAAVIIGLWYFTSGPGVDTNGNFTQVKKVGTNLPLVKSPAIQYFTIKEWGVKFALPNSLSDLQYAYEQPQRSSSFDLSNIKFTTKSLLSSDSNCSASQDPLGEVQKQNGNYTSIPKDNHSQQLELLKQFDAYFLTYSGPQSACGSSEASNKLETTQVQELKSALKTIQ